MDAHIGGLETQNGAVEGTWSPVVADLHGFDTEQDPDPIRIKVKNQFRVGINVKRGIWIRIEVMRIRNPV